MVSHPGRQWCKALLSHIDIAFLIAEYEDDVELLTLRRVPISVTLMKFR